MGSRTVLVKKLARSVTKLNSKRHEVLEGFFGEFRGSGRSFRGRWRRRLPGWTHSLRTMPTFWASTTPGESMLLTFGSMSGESKSAWRTSVRAFPARNAARPAVWPITRRSGAGGTSTRCISRQSWSPGCHGAATGPRREPVRECPQRRPRRSDIAFDPIPPASARSHPGA